MLVHGADQLLLLLLRYEAVPHEHTGEREARGLCVPANREPGVRVEEETMHNLHNKHTTYNSERDTNVFQLHGTSRSKHTQGS